MLLYEHSLLLYQQQSLMFRVKVEWVIVSLPKFLIIHNKILYKTQKPQPFSRGFPFILIKPNQRWDSTVANIAAELTFLVKRPTYCMNCPVHCMKVSLVRVRGRVRFYETAICCCQNQVCYVSEENTLLTWSAYRSEVKWPLSTPVYFAVSSEKSTAGGDGINSGLARCSSGSERCTSGGEVTTVQSCLV
jgi:hypothetical protein